MMMDGYIKLFFGVIAISVVLQIPVFFVLRKKDRGFARQLCFLLCFWSFFLVVFATIILFNLPLRFEPEQSALNLQPLKWLWEGKILQRINTEIVPNIAVFIPLGLFAPIAVKRMRKFHITVLTVFALTLGIESFQYFIGRSSDIDDLIANLSGGIIGYGIYKICNYLYEKRLKK